MTISILPVPSTIGLPADMPNELIWRLRVEQYHAMVRAGVLTDDDPVELLEGWLVYQMPKSPSHRAATRLTQQVLERIIPAGWYVDTQEPVTLDDSEPEPDVAAVRGETRHYLDRHPSPREVALVIEIADTTLRRDRGLKKRLYARAGIAAYWIVNLPESQVEVHSDASGPVEAPDYRQQQVYRLSDIIPVIIAGREVGHVAVRDMLPS